jgi:two-component system, NtrC family, response regulator AtoC
MEKQAATVRLLVVSRDSDVLRVIREITESNLCQLFVASSAWEAMEKLRSDFAVDVLLIDSPSDNRDGFRWLRWLRQLRSALPILLIDRTKQAETEVHSIRVDSNDYLVSPLALSQLQIAIERSLSSTRDASLIDAAGNGVRQPGVGLLFIGASHQMHRVTAQVALLAESDLPVFICGEHGSGKGRIARLLHQLSSRSSVAFAKVDCASLSDELLEREIFGYEPPGGADAARIQFGKLELSAGGTLFLDKIEELPLRLQSRLAAVMESGRLNRAEASGALELNVRVVAGSSLPIVRAISERKIVPELYSHFSTREIRVPPLRERKEELPLLARHYMYELSRQFDLAPKEFPVATEEAWQAHDWPGNLHELKEFVKQFMIEGEPVREAMQTPLDRSRELIQTPRPETSGANQLGAPARQRTSGITGYKSLKSIIRSVREEAERTAIASALEETGWNRKAAARLLKVSYRSILYKIEQYKMGVPDHPTAFPPERLSVLRTEASDNDSKGSSGALLPRAARSIS